MTDGISPLTPSVRRSLSRVSHSSRSSQETLPSYHGEQLPTYDEVLGTAAKGGETEVQRPQGVIRPLEAISEESEEQTISPAIRSSERRGRKWCCCCCLVSSRLFWWGWAGILISMGIVGAIVAAVVVTRDKQDPYANHPSRDYVNYDYALADHFQGESFFSNFDYYDTNNSNETYTTTLVNATTATRENITYYNSTTSLSTLAINSNRSARISTRKTYTTGLFLITTRAIPRSCSYVPTLRLSSTTSWPAPADIRLVWYQGRDVNHPGVLTPSSCSMDVPRQATGPEYDVLLSKECHNATYPLQGCSGSNNELYTSSMQRYGPYTFAVEVHAQGIRIWTKAYDDKMLHGDRINTVMLGRASLDFPENGGCDLGGFFGGGFKIVADVNECGDYDFWGTEAGGKTGGWCEEACRKEQEKGDEVVDLHEWQWSEWRVFQTSGS